MVFLSCRRGFSINADTVDTNMLEHTVYDSVAPLLGQKDIYEPKAVSMLDINKDMLKYCRSTHSSRRVLLAKKGP